MKNGVINLNYYIVINRKKSQNLNNNFFSKRNACSQINIYVYIAIANNKT